MERVFGDVVLKWLAGTGMTRRLADTLLRRRALRRVAELDQVDAARCQARTLQGLVHHARNTPFGRAHDFRRIHTAADFRRLVPLRTALPDTMNSDEPGLIKSHRTAAWTALSLVFAGRPQARLFAGCLLVVGGDGRSSGVKPAVTMRSFPPLLQPYTEWFRLKRREANLLNGPYPSPAEPHVRLPVTGLAGEADELGRCFKQVLDLTGRERIADVWPGLTAVLYTRRPAGTARQDLAAWLGGKSPLSTILMLEACVHAGGVIAVEDPRHDLLRLIPDHGVYFEFVPVEQLGEREPARHTVAEVEPGLPYALALTSSAGLWATLTGQTVRFERRQPPLFHLLETELFTDGLAANVEPLGRHDESPPPPLLLPGEVTRLSRDPAPYPAHRVTRLSARPR
jgi:hypothetical protein